MFKIKRLYTFMLQSFLPLFLMTFFICLFIVLMQFLWRYIDDLVGKGLEISVIAELFFYAALTMVPMALPLAILLASLMTFGNLGERFELTALKAAGISLLKAMKPLIALMVVIAIGAFFFQNNVLPVAQTKMWTLLYSMRQKSPEVEIPEGVFYDQLPGFNIYVKEKNPESGILYDVMIYDTSRGFDNARVLLADSGRMSMTEDQTHLFLTLHHGAQFENLREQQGGAGSGNMPYRRESFDEKQIMVAFDANFNRMDESGMRNQYVGKNIAELQATIDSVSARVDSIGNTYAQSIKEIPYMGIDYYKREYRDGELVRVPQKPVALEVPIDLDSMINANDGTFARSYYTQALVKAKRAKQDYEYKSFTMSDDRKTIRRHGIELQKKFTLSFACIIFFFIGAPLGAIIRKGGLGTPLIISVLLFIVYYIIDNTGYKMAREGRMEVWEGMWLSSAVLLPLGVFFTYKAMNDSAVFNKDAYVNFFTRLLGLHITRHYELKEVAMEDVEPAVALDWLKQLDESAGRLLAAASKRQGYIAYLTKGIDRAQVVEVDSLMNRTIDYIANSREKIIVNKLSDYPVISDFWVLHPFEKRWAGIAAAAVFPAGATLYLLGLRFRRSLAAKLQRTLAVNKELEALFTKQTN